jgi:aspartyl-tRNA(Asn)/glutamyl-tRNA(Gln) amidotransferase subunit A
VRTLIDQAAAIRSGKVSPVELVEDALAGIDRVQPALNAFTHVLADDALGRAKELQGAEPVGPLHGVPIAIKELYDVEGAPTTGCCAAYADRLAASDSAVVEKLRAAGAIVVAKTNQHELACGATTQVSSFGPAFNPWGASRIPGGSSGGSGAAVAAGVVTMAMGSDTGGSIRIPSSFCGVTGLKPTHGAVSLRGAMPMTPSFDTAGPLAVSAADCALVHSLISGPDPGYVWSASQDQREPVESLSGLRVGLLRSFMARLHTESKAGVERAARTLEQLGADVIEIDGLDPWESRQKAIPVLLAEVADCYRDLWSDDRVSPEIALYIQGGRSVTGPDYSRSREDALALRNEFLLAFERVDALIAPTTPFPAPRVDDTEVAVENGAIDVHLGGPATLTLPVNVTGLPSVAFPVGFSANELPLGAQLIGPPWSELRLCSIVDAYQQETDWHLRGPA